MTRSELLALVDSRFEVLELYGQSPVTSVAAAAAPGRSGLVKQAIRLVTNPIVGRGPAAEALLPRLRRTHVPRISADTGFMYVVVVCEKPGD